MRIILWLLVNAAALLVAVWAVPGIDFPEVTGEGELFSRTWPLLVVAAILGAVTLYISPVIKFLAIPFIVVTLGLFLLVINAAMLLLTGWLAGILGLGFTVDGFWSAVLGAIIITLVTGCFNLIFDNATKPTT